MSLLKFDPFCCYIPQILPLRYLLFKFEQILFLIVSLSSWGCQNKSIQFHSNSNRNFEVLLKYWSSYKLSIYFRTPHVVSILVRQNLDRDSAVIHVCLFVCQDLYTEICFSIDFFTLSLLMSCSSQVWVFFDKRMQNSRLAC